MTTSTHQAAPSSRVSEYPFSRTAIQQLVQAFGDWLRAAPPALLYGLRLWGAVCMALLLAFWLELDNPYWAGATAAAVCTPVLGASMRKGWFRLVGTVLGVVSAVVLSAFFSQSRAGFLIGLALWGGICAFGATLLRNFASYAAALAGYTAAIIAGGELGLVGGANGDAFNLAVARGTEIGIGIVCAGLVLTMTDFGDARRRLATMLTDISAEILAGLIHALSLVGPVQAASRTARRSMIQRVAALDAVIDQASGEISAMPLRPRELRAATDRFFAALAAWRSVADHLELAPDAIEEATRVRGCLPRILTDLETTGTVPGERGDPHAIRNAIWIAVRRLLALPAETPSLQLLRDQTAAGLLALSIAIDGVMLLDHPWMAGTPRCVAGPRVADTLPALINAVRAFVTIGAAELVWVWTGWPGGTTFIIFATIAITLFGPREDSAYASAKSFTIGTAIAAVFAAIAAFVLLPGQSSFIGLCAVLGLVLIPSGELSSRSWQQPLFVALGTNFVALLRPSNPAIYDPELFYNTAAALLCGVGFAMLAMRLLPAMPAETRVRRLLALTLRDLRSLTHASPPNSAAGWEGRLYSRLSAIPDSVDTLQAARMTAALSVGGEIIRLRHIAHRFAIAAELEPALTAIAAGKSGAAIRALNRFDQALAVLPAGLPGAKPRARARGTILSIAGSLARHASFFDAEVRA